MYEQWSVSILVCDEMDDGQYIARHIFVIKQFYLKIYKLLNSLICLFIVC